MRLFHCHPSGLPTSLLSRQHQTAHLLLTAVASGKDLGGMTRYRNSAGFIAWVHLRCAEELLIRGLNHESPIHALWARIPERQRKVDIFIPPTRYLRDRRDLLMKIGNVDKGGQMSDTRIKLDEGLQRFASDLAQITARGLPSNFQVI